MQPCEEALHQALTLSESMCSAAEEGQWEQVHEVTQRRDALLRLAFSPDQVVAGNLSELLRKLSTCDQYLLALARDRRCFCQQRVLGNTTARNATRAYNGVRRLAALQPSKT